MARFDLLVVDLKINSSRSWIEPGENGRSARSADGSLAMSVRKEYAPRGEAIDVWRLGVGVAVEAADPVIQVVNRDEKNIRFVGGSSFRRENAEEKQGSAKSERTQDGFHV